MIVAGLTMLRAFAAKGYPDAGHGTMQSFQSWARIVAGCISFAGGPNVLDAVGTDEAAGTDEAGAYVTFVRDLQRLSTEPMTSKAILDALYPAPRKEASPRTDGNQCAPPSKRSPPPAEGFRPRRLVWVAPLKSEAGQVTGGTRLRGHRDRDGFTRWTVETILRTPPK